MMRWDGTREGIERICAWANEGLHPFDDGPWLEFEHRVDSSIIRDLVVAITD